MDIKMYDRDLSIKKLLDGTVEIERPSVYDRRNVFSIAKFKNMYTGSSRHIVERLKSMDSTRTDFFASALQKNLNLRKTKSDDRMHRDVADFIRNGTAFVG